MPWRLARPPSSSGPTACPKISCRTRLSLGTGPPCPCSCPCATPPGLASFWRSTSTARQCRAGSGISTPSISGASSSGKSLPLRCGSTCRQPGRAPATARSSSVPRRSCFRSTWRPRRRAGALGSSGSSREPCTARSLECRGGRFAAHRLPGRQAGGSEAASSERDGESPFLSSRFVFGTEAERIPGEVDSASRSREVQSLRGTWV
mmetsp:Transcript_84633/g.181333  ORF Transcript_84633/g.181333 Transcript_84633/m.181333 type:complete len:206 (-) Transcript_84633:16-633(-)